jgi:hypothetical protein
MELIAKYRLYAEQCRALAAQMRSLEFKQALDAMAREWRPSPVNGKLGCWKKLIVVPGLTPQHRERRTHLQSRAAADAAFAGTECPLMTQSGH